MREADVSANLTTAFLYRTPVNLVGLTNPAVIKEIYAPIRQDEPSQYVKFAGTKANIPKEVSFAMCRIWTVEVNRSDRQTEAVRTDNGGGFTNEFEQY